MGWDSTSGNANAEGQWTLFEQPRHRTWDQKLQMTTVYVSLPSEPAHLPCTPSWTSQCTLYQHIIPLSAFILNVAFILL